MSVEMIDTKINETLKLVDDAWDLMKRTGRRQTVCVFGQPGIGKTEGLIQWAKKKGVEAYVIPCPQLEETGDLMGLPDVKVDESGRKRTTYDTPEYLPTSGEGIIIADDFNRANNLILQSMLHFSQFYEFGTYRVPLERVEDKNGNVEYKGYIIVLTGNPDDGKNIVNEIDDAHYSRWWVVNQVFDEVEWAKWAEGKIDERFVNFILKYPEVVSNRHNARAWANGFLGVKPDLSNLERVMMAAVGPTNFATLQNYLETDWKAISQFNLEDIYSNDPEKHNKLIKLLKEGANDFRALIALRLSAINLQNRTQKDKKALQAFLPKLENALSKDQIVMIVQSMWQQEPMFILDDTKLAKWKIEQDTRGMAWG